MKYSLPGNTWVTYSFYNKAYSRHFYLLSKFTEATNDLKTRHTPQDWLDTMTAPGMGYGDTSPQMCRLAPTVKHTGQESEGELNCANFLKKFDRFCSQNL